MDFQATTIMEGKKKVGGLSRKESDGVDEGERMQEGVTQRSATRESPYQEAILRQLSSPSAHRHLPTPSYP